MPELCPWCHDPVADHTPWCRKCGCRGEGNLDVVEGARASVHAMCEDVMRVCRVVQQRMRAPQALTSPVWSSEVAYLAAKVSHLAWTVADHARAVAVLRGRPASGQEPLPLAGGSTPRQSASVACDGGPDSRPGRVSP